MKSLFEQLGIAFFGLITTLLVVAVEVIIGQSGYHVSGFSWNLIPVGAIGMGALAASGYYFGAVYTHNRANVSLLFFMAIVAALADILIHWFDFTLFVRSAGYRESFGSYLQEVFEHTHVRMIGRGIGYRDIGEVGWFGYLLALRRFAGFLIGGIVVYFMLQSRKICPSCSLYLDKLRLGQHVFPTAETVISYLENFRRNVMDSSSLFSLIGAAATPEKVQEGSFRVTSSVFGCPICARRVIDHEVATYAGGEWKDLDDLKVSMEFELVDGQGSNEGALPAVSV